MAISESDRPSVIGVDGVVVPPSEAAVVQLVLTVTRLSDGSTADTAPLSVTVPARSVAEPTADWAHVELSASTVQQGGAIDVVLTGLEPGQIVTAVLHSDPLEIAGIPVAGQDGRIAFRVGIPADFEPGAHTLVLASPGFASITVAVQVLPAGALSGSGVALPLSAVGVALLMLVLGTLALRLRARRRRING